MAIKDATYETAEAARTGPVKPILSTFSSSWPSSAWLCCVAWRPCVKPNCGSDSSPNWDRDMPGSGPNRSCYPISMDVPSPKRLLRVCRARRSGVLLGIISSSQHESVESTREKSRDTRLKMCFEQVFGYPWCEVTNVASHPQAEATERRCRWAGLDCSQR